MEEARRTSAPVPDDLSDRLALYLATVGRLAEGRVRESESELN